MAERTIEMKPSGQAVEKAFMDANYDLHSISAISVMGYRVGTDEQLLEMISDPTLREIIGVRLIEARLVGRREALDFARGGRPSGRLDTFTLTPALRGLLGIQPAENLPSVSIAEDSVSTDSPALEGWVRGVCW